MLVLWRNCHKAVQRGPSWLFDGFRSIAATLSHSAAQALHDSPQVLHSAMHGIVCEALWSTPIANSSSTHGVSMARRAGASSNTGLRNHSLW
jgi:hypothetical protein